MFMKSSNNKTICNQLLSTFQKHKVNAGRPPIDPRRVLNAYVDRNTVTIDELALQMGPQLDALYIDPIMDM